MRNVKRARRGAGVAFAFGITAVLVLEFGPAAAGNELAEFYGQELDWQQCEEPEPLPPSEQPEDGIIIDPWKGQWKHMECATVRVPLNYERPDDGTLTIEVSRIRAKDPERRQGVLVFNPGGPGGGGLSMPLGAREYELADSFDLIGFDPRGVGRSSKLLCETVDDPRPDTTRPSDEQFSAYAEYARAREEACERGGGGIRPYINTANTGRDMDVIRDALGEKKINYLGYSYGTYLGAVYGSLFPEGLNRSVLDSSDVGSRVALTLPAQTRFSNRTRPEARPQMTRLSVIEQAAMCQSCCRTPAGSSGFPRRARQSSCTDARKARAGTHPAP